MKWKITAPAILGLVAAVVVGAYLLGRRPANGVPEKPGPAAEKPAPLRPLSTITVEASYPGASALVVTDTVAAPIEEQINGVTGMLSMYSRSTNDGTYRLTVSFAPNTDMNMAQVLVQNRVALAMPQLPDVVRQAGTTVRKKSSCLLGFVVLSSPDGRFSALYLSNYATLQIKDELARVEGVADVVALGRRDYALRVLLDPDKLASRNLTAVDVTTALAEQNIQIAFGRIGQPPVPQGQAFELTLTALGRLADPETLGKLVLKADREGRVVHLRDVARLEMGAAAAAEYPSFFNGKPVVALGLAWLPGAKPREVLAAVREKLAALRARLPEGAELALAFNFADNLEAPDQDDTPEYLRLDLTLPDAASAERTQAVAARCEKILRDTTGVRDVLILGGPPFAVGTNEALLLVSLMPPNERPVIRQQLLANLRRRFVAEIEEARVQLCDVTKSEQFPLRGDAVEFALEDRGNVGAAALQKTAEELATRLSARPELADVRVSDGGRPHPQKMIIEIDRTRAKALGAELSDVLDTLRAALGPVRLNGQNVFPPARIVEVQVDRPFREDILKLQVRTATGQTVSLSTLASVRQPFEPDLVERYNRYRMVSVAATPTPGVSLAEARELIETVFAEVCPKSFALESMRPSPPRGVKTPD